MNKKLIKFKPILLLCLLISTFAVSQTVEQRKEISNSYNQELLSQLSLEYSKTFTKDFEEAKAYAVANNIPLIIEKENGFISVLHKVLEDGTLIYTTTTNEGAGLTVRTDKVYTGGGLDLSVEGEGMLIGVWDGGAVRANHELIGTNRVTQMDGATGLSSHATHVSGTIMGSDTPQGGVARGMAFKAHLQANDFGNDASEMVAQAADGLLISNHSYGYGAEDLPLYLFGNYDGTAQSVDNILYSAPYYTAVFSAGNDRNAGYNSSDNGYDLLTDRGVAKNGITVAAVNEVTNYTGPNSVSMSNFSSWGPTDDGRIKPDISAKGVNTFSSIATSNTAYGNMSGTSMATPSVTGALALLQELYSDIHGNFMKSATLKALAIHTALEAGTFPGPDFKFGWGLLNIEDAAIAVLNEDFQSVIEEHSLSTGNTFTKTVTSNGVDPLVVTMVWTDPAGNIQSTTVDDSTPHLVNDLDITLEDAAGNLSFPWRINSVVFGLAAVKAVNSVDNVEKVEIDAPSGDYTITVTHKGGLVSGNQDFSLIATGISESDFTFTPDNISKTYCSNTVAQYDFNYVSSDTFNGPTNLSVSGLPAGAIATFTPAVITADEDFILEISGLESVSAGTYNFVVTGTSGSLTKNSDLELQVDSALPLNDAILNYPNDGETNVFIYPELTWDADLGATQYKIEVSELSGFTNTIYEGILIGNSISIPGLASNTQYYWRVRPESACVFGSFTTASFTTETVACSGIVSASDTPIAIGITPIIIESVINIPAVDNILIGDINVTMGLTHSWLADLTISVISPSGTEVILMNGACDGNDNASVTFDDSGFNFMCTLNTPSLDGIMKPENALAPFINENSEGDWTLRVIDGYDEDGGALTSFSIELCSTAGPLSIDEKQITDFAIFPNPAKNYFEFSLSSAQNNLKLGVYDVNGRLLFDKTFDGQQRKVVNTENLSGGIYFVEIINGNQRAVKKLVIK
jgi:subtilisin-like proprotein convertase family protein